LSRQQHIPYRKALAGTLIVSLVPPVYALVQYYVLGNRYCPEGGLWINIAQTTIFSLVITFCLFIVNIYFNNKGNDLMYGKVTEGTRIFITVFVSLIASNIVIYFLWQFFDHVIFHLPAEGEKERIFSNQILATVLVIIVDLIIEVDCYVKKLKASMEKQAHLEKEFIRAQLESLKTQISPHFLFNSFNALQSLIDQSPEQARAFIQELSRVYRYVLDKKDEMVVPLSDEVQFIRSFLYLNHIRFGNSLTADIKLSAADLDGFIPPLTLQLLVENAIKHNIISQAKPLHIDVFRDGDIIIVRNNVQLRADAATFSGIGQSNLIARYELISDRRPIFGIEENAYIAKVPVLEQEL
jgi:hypothetical protein